MSVEMPAGICIGHFDKKFKECRSCVVKDTCKQITIKFNDDDFFKQENKIEEVEKPQIDKEIIDKSFTYLKRKIKSSLKSTHCVVEGVDIFHIETSSGGLFLQVNDQGCYMIQTDVRTISTGYVESKNIAREIIKTLEEYAN